MAKRARITAKAKPKASPQTFIQRSRSKGAAEKAYYHNITGAGGKTVRKFLGTTPEEGREIRRTLVDGMRQDLARRARRA
jgi:hypothetical protein